MRNLILFTALFVSATVMADELTEDSGVATTSAPKVQLTPAQLEAGKDLPQTSVVIRDENGNIRAIANVNEKLDKNAPLPKNLSFQTAVTKGERTSDGAIPGKDELTRDSGATTAYGFAWSGPRGSIYARGGWGGGWGGRPGYWGGAYPGINYGYNNWGYNYNYGGCGGYGNCGGCYTSCVTCCQPVVYSYDNCNYPYYGYSDPYPYMGGGAGWTYSYYGRGW